MWNSQYYFGTSDLRFPLKKDTPNCPKSEWVKVCLCVSSVI